MPNAKIAWNNVEKNSFTVIEITIAKFPEAHGVYTGGLQTVENSTAHLTVKHGESRRTIRHYIRQIQSQEHIGKIRDGTGGNVAHLKRAHADSLNGFAVTAKNAACGQLNLDLAVALFVEQLAKVLNPLTKSGFC